MKNEIKGTIYAFSFIIINAFMNLWIRWNRYYYSLYACMIYISYAPTIFQLFCTYPCYFCFIYLEKMSAVEEKIEGKQFMLFIWD